MTRFQEIKMLPKSCFISVLCHVGYVTIRQRSLKTLTGLQNCSKRTFRNVSKALEASQSSPFNSGTLSSTPKTFRAFSEKILYQK